jgi:hypothetical protein
LILALALITYKVAGRPPSPTFEAAEVNTELPEIEPFELGDTPIDPTDLSTESLTIEPPAVEAKYFDNADKFEDQGGGVMSDAQKWAGAGGPDMKALSDGARLMGGGGLGGSSEAGEAAGIGGAGEGFGGRGAGHREEMLSAYGGTRESERAVAGALNWLARHQLSNGSWSLGEFSNRCKGEKCSGRGHVRSDAAGTALGLLPFLAAGQTQSSEGPYKAHIERGVNWMVKNQKADGDLTPGSEQQMYSHGLAAIALCEDYGLTNDSKVRVAAQNAIRFIERAQNRTTGGWRYRPGDEGDTSVVGWMVMALKSAHMANLVVDPQSFEGATKYLKTCAKSAKGGVFSYTPIQGPTPTMSAVGLLCTQYLGAKREDPAMLEGKAYLLGNLPGRGQRNIYYWYYGTQVMHNLLGPEWDRWNRQTRRTLIETQSREGCSSGSWEPGGEAPDKHGDQGGRIMTTSLSALTLEVYYRYLPLYKLETPAQKGAAEATEKPADKGKKPVAMGK